MVTSSGRSEVSNFIMSIPAALEDRVLRGAARAGAQVVATEAKHLSVSSEVAAAIKIATSLEDGRVIAKVQVKGRGAYIAPWLEYGTDPHFISVDESQRQGMSIGRINKQVREGSLIIGGNFVGSTVFHPGARPYPFLRPALDTKAGEAVAAAQSYINVRVTPAGIAAGRTEGDGE